MFNKIVNQRLRYLKEEKHKISLMIRSLGHASDEEIKDLEGKYMLTLPEDYKNFLKENNGGQSPSYEFENSIEIKNINEEINVATLYGIKTAVKNFDIEDWTDEYLDDLFSNSIIIGDSLQHGFLVLWLSGDEDEGIYYYDDTYNLEASSDENNAYFLARTFTEFLELVQN